VGILALDIILCACSNSPAISAKAEGLAPLYYCQIAPNRRLACETERRSGGKKFGRPFACLKAAMGEKLIQIGRVFSVSAK
jgi:hypothetical protein